MRYQDMSKEQLLKEVVKLDKQLNQKKVERLSWKKIMAGTLCKGPGYWSNGHFALINDIEIPKAALNLVGLMERTPDTEMQALVGDKERKETDRSQWKEITESNMVKVVTEHGVKFQKLYITMLDKLIPGFVLKVLDNESPAVIEKDGQVMGVLMPVRV